MQPQQNAMEHMMGPHGLKVLIYTGQPEIRTLSTCGIETAGLCVGGAPALTATEEYNGTSWTSVNDLNNGRQSAGIFGVQTSAIYAGGRTSSFSSCYRIL